MASRNSFIVCYFDISNAKNSLPNSDFFWSFILDLKENHKEINSPLPKTRYNNGTMGKEGNKLQKKKEKRSRKKKRSGEEEKVEEEEEKMKEW